MLETVKNDASVAAGLTSVRAAELLAEVGPNTLPEARGGQLLRLVGAQLTHLLALLLWAASVLALLAGMPELAAAIVVIVLLNAGFAVWQEHRADRSAEELRTLIPNRVRVVRDGEPRSVEAAQLVPGDVVALAAGDRVGADMRVVTAHELRLDESLVTGESRPVPHAVDDELVTGSFVTQGAGHAQVTATGPRTKLAAIAVLAQSARRPPSPLTVQLARVVRVVAVLAVGTGAGLGLTAVGLGLDVTEAFLFGVGVTVALVPEGLLPTVTLSLARGAQLMARDHALVRHLDAVETLGATTYICTDKTGTLTQNSMQVVDVVTMHGRAKVEGSGYVPSASLHGSPATLAALPDLVRAARSCVTGQVVRRERWVAEGDPMEAAIDCLARRVEGDVRTQPHQSRSGLRAPTFHARSDDELGCPGGTAHGARCPGGGLREVPRGTSVPARRPGGPRLAGAEGRRRRDPRAGPRRRGRSTVHACRGGPHGARPARHRGPSSPRRR
jgi:magnesium-transporting ATPase (P-type)